MSEIRNTGITEKPHFWYTCTLVNVAIATSTLIDFCNSILWTRSQIIDILTSSRRQNKNDGMIVSL